MIIQMSREPVRRYRAPHTAVPQSNTKLILHWIDNSRAKRIVWLFEELGLEYLIKPYEYTEEFGTPNVLKSVHSLGRVPVLEVQEGAQTKYIAESGHILNYVLEHFDGENLVSPESQEDRELVDYFIHFSEGTLHVPIKFSLVLDIAERKVPWYTKPFVSSYVSNLKRTFCVPNTMKSVKLLEKHLGDKNVEGRELYLVGSKLSGADIMVSWSFTQSLTNPELWSNGFEIEEFPHINRWLTGLKSRPGYLRTLQKEEQFCNELALKKGLPAKL